MRTGRPSLPEKERKSATLRVRMTEAEKALIEKATSGKPSAWARDVLVKAAKRKSKA